MATLSRGQTFGTTEQVTNTKLHNLVDLGSISGITGTDLGSAFMSSLPSSAGKINVQNLWSQVNIATNTSFPNVGNGTHFNLFHQTFVSLASFVNMRVGQQFTLIAQQASYPTILDSTNFKLSADWIPQKQYDNITLWFNGSVVVELNRTAT